MGKEAIYDSNHNFIGYVEKEQIKEVLRNSSKNIDIKTEERKFINEYGLTCPKGKRVNEYGLIIGDE